MSATVTEYRRGTRVVLTEDMPGVPEGTPGKCGRGLGFAIKRYRVRFDNNVDATSVAHSKLVPEGEWPQFIAQRARQAIEAAQDRARTAEARAAAAETRGLPAASVEPADTGGTSADSSTGDAAAGETPGDSGGDPRLAALLARSSKARDATGVAAPDSTTAGAADPTPAAPTPAAPEPVASTPAVSTDTTAASGPPRVEIPEFVPGPQVAPVYAPASNRISDLLEQVRNDD